MPLPLFKPPRIPPPRHQRCLVHSFPKKFLCESDDYEYEKYSQAREGFYLFALKQGAFISSIAPLLSRFSKDLRAFCYFVIARNIQFLSSKPGIPLVCYGPSRPGILAFVAPVTPLLRSPGSLRLCRCHGSSPEPRVGPRAAGHRPHGAGFGLGRGFHSHKT